MQTKFNQEEGSKSEVVLKDHAPEKLEHTVALKSEMVLNSPPKDGIHEGQISKTHGYVPFQPISPSLPEKYKAWEELGRNLPRYLSEGSEREHIKELPLLDSDDLEQLPNEHLSRAIAIIGNIAHTYYFNQRLGYTQETDPLPKSVLIPWQQLTKRIHRKLPPDSIGSEIQAVRIHYDTFLTNWQLKKSDFKIDGIHNSELTLKDLSILSPIFDNPSEYHFNMTFVIMELRFAQAFQHMTNAIKAVANKDDDALILALQKMTSCIEEITDGLDYINPNQYSEHYVDPTVWTKTVAKIDGKIPGGISGLSGSAMPLFHTIDRFIERKDYKSSMGMAMMKKYKHQPEYIQKYLSALSDDLNIHSIRDYVAKSQNPILKNQYDLLIESYLGENGLMGVHTLKVYGYMKTNFRLGRLETNGGHDGTATVETEPQRHIYDDFAHADVERLADYRPTQQYATKIGMKVYKGKAAVIDLDVSKTALHFQPGDHCAIHPENYDEAINVIVTKFKVNLSDKIKLNKTWKEFALRHLNCEEDAIELGELLKHADLRAFDKSFNAEELKPLASRYYSVSPLPSSPQQIRLTVGMHANGDGKSMGLCSSYLMSDATKFAIERIPARHFHLPKSKETIILMFAAGTGISPFMGMISERAKYSDKSKNLLFYSTPSMESFYHQEDLGKAVLDNQLDASVIFSRGTGYDSGTFTTKGFEPTAKYKGKHIDQLIEEQAKKIADLIVTQKAQIYVCGNHGFANAVRTAVIKALSAHSDIPNPTKYVDTMMADFRFNNDVYSAIDYTQKYSVLPASEIATHNKPDDCWAIINGSVYDLTRFIHTHPGGQKIILVNGGIDMSGDYNYIKHNQRPQIEGLLQQYKIGIVATPDLHKKSTFNLYEKSRKFLEALTEMENTLRNNTTYVGTKDQAYMWREVYSVFVDGSLASYRKPGTGSAGSLNYVLGSLLKELCVAANSSTSPLETLFEEIHKTTNELMSQGSACGNYIRQSSTGPLSEDELHQKKKIFEMVLKQTFKLVGDLKGLAIELLKEIEAHSDEYDEKLIVEKLKGIIKTMSIHSGLLKHIVTSLPKLEKTALHVGEMDSGGCVFAKQLLKDTGSTTSTKSEPKLEKTTLDSDEMRSGSCVFAKEPSSTKESDVDALCQFGFMAKPKSKPRPKSFWMPDPVNSACTIF